MRSTSPPLSRRREQVREQPEVALARRGAAPDQGDAAHGIVGELVRYCLASKKTLQSLTLQEYQQISPQFDEAVLGVVSLQEAVNNKNSRGGTAYLHVLDAIRQAKEDLGRAC